MITVNGKQYAPDDLVPWEDAIAESGFYYERARYLGLPEPTAIQFDETAAGHYKAMGDYQLRMARAEAKAAGRIGQ